jgi:hypothetical protein
MTVCLPPHGVTPRCPPARPGVPGGPNSSAGGHQMPPRTPLTPDSRPGDRPPRPHEKPRLEGRRVPGSCRLPGGRGLDLFLLRLGRPIPTRTVTGRPSAGRAAGRDPHHPYRLRWRLWVSAGDRRAAPTRPAGEPQAGGAAGRRPRHRRASPPLPERSEQPRHSKPMSGWRASNPWTALIRTGPCQSQGETRHVSLSRPLPPWARRCISGYYGDVPSDPHAHAL